MNNTKSKRRFTQPRSFEMNLVAYYLARCSLAYKPPIVLGFDNWNSAYEYFRRAVGDGREIKTFRNSIDPVRRSFDKLLSDDKQHEDEICEKDQSFHNKWKALSNEELEKRVLKLVSGESQSGRDSAALPGNYEDCSAGVAKVGMSRKYTTENLLPALRLFIETRNRSLESGLTDNGGAIHSVERILDILSMHVRYPHLTHIHGLKDDPAAEISVQAHEARERGEREKLQIEHVLPQRAYAQKVIELVNDGATDEEILRFIKENYRLVLLTREETATINRLNRSRITKDRIADAGVALSPRETG